MVLDPPDISAYFSSLTAPDTIRYPIIWIRIPAVKARLAKKIIQVMSLTQCPCKIQSLNQIPFFNFIKSICYISWSRCLKFIDVWLAPFDPRVGVQISPKCQKRENNLSLYWNHFKWKSQRLLCCLKPQRKFFLEFPHSWENWEFFANLVFEIF